MNFCLFDRWILFRWETSPIPWFWGSGIKALHTLLLLNKSEPNYKYINVTSHHIFSTTKKECEGALNNSSVFNDVKVYLVEFFLFTGIRHPIRGALVFQTAERQWEDSWSAGLHMPCCFLLQGMRDDLAWWWWCLLRHGYWLFEKQICLFSQDQH